MIPNNHVIIVSIVLDTPVPIAILMLLAIFVWNTLILIKTIFIFTSLLGYSVT